MIAIIASSVLALATAAVAAPLEARTSSISSGGFNSGLSSFSLNGWGGFSSLDHFDDFFGQGNFNGCNNQQTILSETVTCQTQEITVIQQQLSIVTEFAKRVILEQICEVEVQTIVWNQFVSSFSSFSQDITHVSGRSIGYDHVIASHISGLVDSSNHLIQHDFGFQGLNIGSNLINVHGSNWVSGSSQISVQSAIIASQTAHLSSSNTFTQHLVSGSSGSSGGFGGFGASSGTFNIGSI